MAALDTFRIYGWYFRGLRAGWEAPASMEWVCFLGESLSDWFLHFTMWNITIDWVVLSERIDISIDPFTGRNPSYCFVELETKEQAEQAMQQLDGRDFLGRPLKIRLGVSKSPIDDSPQTESPFAFNRWRLCYNCLWTRWSSLCEVYGLMSGF